MAPDPALVTSLNCVILPVLYTPFVTVAALPVISISRLVSPLIAAIASVSV